jgi:hypothetical protein
MDKKAMNARGARDTSHNRVVEFESTQEQACLKPP